MSLELLRSSVSTVLVDRLGGTWDELYGELKRYRDEHGDPNVPSRHPNRELARWVVKQRVAYREHRLKEWKKEKLLSVNFAFERGDLDRRNRKYMTFTQARSLVRSQRLTSLDG